MTPSRAVSRVWCVRAVGSTRGLCRGAHTVITKMKKPLVFAAALQLVAALSATPPPCSLNGELVGGSCVCDKPWSGAECSTLNFLPVTFPQGYGMAPNLTTWGGNAIFDGSEYHIFVSAMTNGCPLSTWTHNSRIDHGVSSHITGPYKFRDVAIPTWAHNAAPITLKDGTYAIVHIGDGDGSPTGGNNCTAPPPSPSPPPPSPCHAFSCSGGDPSAAPIWCCANQTCQGYHTWEPTCYPPLSHDAAASSGVTDVEDDGASDADLVEGKGNQAGSTIHVSPSLEGPWTPLVPNTLGHCNNPAPWVHSNGTIFIVCGNAMKRAESISGPWETVSTFTHSGGPAGNYEDPFLYADHRGFHLLYHVYNTHENPPHGHECFNSTVSAHGFSVDGFTWYTSPTQPYGTQIELTTGETITVATRERPKLYIDSTGRKTHLFNGVCSASSCPAGPPTGCVDCKYANWDYTLVQPLVL